MEDKPEIIDPQIELAELRQKNQALEDRIIFLEERNQDLEARYITLQKLNGKDNLTGLDNRQRFDEELEREISLAVRDGQPVSLIFADIDLFKRINDTKGHQAGDAVLQGVAAALEHGLREGDRACRYGGEEFVAILRGISSEAARGVAERLRHIIENLETPFQEEELKATISSGVNSFYPKVGIDRTSHEEIIEIKKGLVTGADEAMYIAKNAGRNRTGYKDSKGKYYILEKSPTNHNKMISVPIEKN